MSNKSVKGQSMKGLLKGLRYISQIFDDENGEEDEVEIQIGLPTDVKHVAHIGSDGPSNHDGPSWLNEFKPETRVESTAIVPVPAASRKKDPRIKSTSEDSRGKKPENCEGRDLTEIRKSSRRHSLTNKSGDGTLKKKESKNKHSKRQISKEYSEGDVKTSRKSQETDMTSSTCSRNLPDVPKKTRGRKSKEMVSDGESSKSRSKGDSNGLCSSEYSENGHDSDTILQPSNPRQPSPIPNFEGGGKEYR